MDDWPEGRTLYGITQPGVANCDVLLGEPDAAHRGLGPEVVRALLERHIFADARVTSCVIDPHVGNAIAIRAYEKVGFRFLHVAPDDGDGRAVYLMELRREDFVSPPPSSAVWLRPARPGELSVAVDIDDDASRMFADANTGIALERADQHPFAHAERRRWADAAADNALLFACRGTGDPVGFSVVNLLDGRPHLDQVSVRRSAMRQGIGRALVDRAIRWSTREGELWLTTYDQIPWNRPWYERLGFERVAESEHGPELRRTLAAERAALPAPAQRIALRYRHR
jgi:GNAT superfamily N-acetyltransferase